MKQTASQIGIVIKEIGSFFAGGQTVTLTSQPRRQLQITSAGPARKEFMQVKSVWIAQQTTTAYPFIMC